MKTKYIAYVILPVLFGLPISLQAQLLLEGRIDFLTRSEIIIDDFSLKLSPTVKIFSTGLKTIPLDTLKLGDKVEIEVHQFGRKLFVDRIQLLK